MECGQEGRAKRALKPRQIWAIRFFLDRESRLRDRALFDLAIDSKLRGCDLMKIKIGTLSPVLKFDTGRSLCSRRQVVQFNSSSTADVRASLLAWLERRGGSVKDHAFPSSINHSAAMSTR